MPRLRTHPPGLPGSLRPGHHRQGGAPSCARPERGNAASGRAKTPLKPVAFATGSRGRAPSCARPDTAGAASGRANTAFATGRVTGRAPRRKSGNRRAPTFRSRKTLKPVASRPGRAQSSSLAWFDGARDSRRRDARRSVGCGLAARRRYIVVAADARPRPAAPGLTLLEAATVGGDPLAVEALASALGQVFRAEHEPGRVAVAMSGGVDSAVTCSSRPERPRRHAAPLAGPAGPSAERACCSTEAVAAARATCRARRAARDARPAPGVPRGRRRPVRGGYASETPRTRARAATERSGSTPCSRSPTGPGGSPLDRSLRAGRRA